MDRIFIYKKVAGESIKLRFETEIPAISGLDNFSVGDDGNIYVAGHSEGWVRL